MIRLLSISLVLTCLILGSGCEESKKLGPIQDGGYLVSTGQLLHPAGAQTFFNGRPLDLRVLSDGDTLVAKDSRGLVFVSIATGKVIQELSLPGGTSYTGLAVSPDGSVWVSNAESAISCAAKGADGRFAWVRRIDLPAPKIGGAAYPCGIALARDGRTAFVCLSRNNALCRVELDTGKTEQIDCDICPYEVVLSPDGSSAYVTCWGGAPPAKDQRSADSSGTRVEVDERGIAKGGSVAAIDLMSRTQTARIPVGLQPSGAALTKDGSVLFVANANSDTVSVISARDRKVIRSIATHPERGQLFGSAPNALVLSPDEKQLYVALGGSNAVMAAELGPKDKMLGLIPTGWYPDGLALAGKTLCVANLKGIGSRAGPREGGGHSVYDFRGSISLIPIPNRAELAKMTKAAKLDAKVAESLRALERSRSKATPIPVPKKLGEPSTIEHVVYILKENRTYDQVFGDLSIGDGEPKLCTFPREVTPNHHALAEQFVLLDNYYCNGVNSADGHAWAMEANASAHLERSFGGWTRSYPFGDDALSYTSTGFIWDNVLAHGLTFRNYGEFDYTDPTPDTSFKAVYDDFLESMRAEKGLLSRKVKLKHAIGVERAKFYANPDAPGWGMKIPDVLRAQVFIDELKEFEKKGTFPNFVILYLPQDHTSGASPGMPTARAHVADNDLALGRVVEALSKSPFWKKMAIFVNEDDPQNGFDHVDGHRSLCLVVSPWVKRRAVVSEFYNQTSAIHTMEQILGIPPMNQMDALSPLMSACFTGRPDFSPYACLPNGIPLDQITPEKAALKGTARSWAERSAKLDFSRPDAGNDDLRNRILWYSTMGATPYPKQFAGAHGAGLRARGLSLVARVSARDRD